MNKNKYFITVNVFSGEDKDEPEVNVVSEDITKATFKKEDRADVIRLCRELDISPYPMIYDKEHCDPIGGNYAHTTDQERVVRHDPVG